MDGVDLRALPLTPSEGFVLSRIDGTATIDDLADLTNLDAAHVAATVRKLIEVGAVEWADGAVSLPRASMRPATTSEPGGPRPIPAPKPQTRPVITESRPPDATREPRPVHVPRPPRSPSSVPLPERELSSEPGTGRRAPPHVEPGRSESGRDARASRAPSAVTSGSRPRIVEESGPASSSRERANSPPPGPRSITPPPSMGSVPPRAPIASGSAPPGTMVPPSSASGSSAAERSPGASSRTSGAPPPSPAPAWASPSMPPSPPGREAAPEVELSPERRKRVDELYPVLELLDHYEVLSLPRSADLKQVRATYFELSKVFHPDTAFRKNLGPYKAKMEAIFTRLTEAYDVLGKKKARAEYDAYLALQGDTRAVEAAITPSGGTPPPPSAPAPSRSEPATPAPGAAPASDSNPAVARPSVSPSSDSSPLSSRPMSGEARRRARELLQLRLQGARSSSSSPSMPAPPTSSVPPSRGRDAIVRDLATSLKSTASITGGLEPASRHAREAQRRELDGDLAGASRELRTAIALAPGRDDLVLEHQRVSKLLAAELADKYQQAAEYEERHRKWAAAAASWSKVVEGRPDDLRAHIQGALAFVEANGDLHQAQRLARRACELAPSDAIARRTLGRVYLAAGLQLNARRELERAAMLDPADQIVKNLLGELKG